MSDFDFKATVDQFKLGEIDIYEVMDRAYGAGYGEGWDGAMESYFG